MRGRIFRRMEAGAPYEIAQEAYGLPPAKHNEKAGDGTDRVSHGSRRREILNGGLFGAAIRRKSEASHVERGVGIIGRSNEPPPPAHT